MAFALEGDPKFSEVVRRHLLRVVRERTKSLEEDIAAGGHREGNMEFYWDTAEIRAYDLVSPAPPPEERKSIETFYRQLGHYWKDSLSRWTTTPNLVFPIHYHAAICFAVDRPQSARFQGATIRISISPGEPLWFGLATADEFESWWRSRKRKQASR